MENSIKIIVTSFLNRHSRLFHGGHACQSDYIWAYKENVHISAGIYCQWFFKNSINPKQQFVGKSCFLFLSTDQSGQGNEFESYLIIQKQYKPPLFQMILDLFGNIGNTSHVAPSTCTQIYWHTYYHCKRGNARVYTLYYFYTDEEAIFPQNQLFISLNQESDS